MRNLCFALATCLAIVAPIATITLSNAGVPFPEWSAIGQDKSPLEKRYYQKWENPTLADLNGKFQDRFEKYLSDHVPMRDRTLLVDAAMERAPISLAARFAGYSTFHTFYDSGYVIDTQYGLTLEQSLKAPPKDNSKRERQRKEWVSALNAAAEAYPESHFVYDIILEPQEDKANPTYSLLSGDLVDEQWTQSNIVEPLSPSIDTFIDGVGGIENLQSDYHKNDNHWTLERALQSYNRIANKLNLEPYSWIDDTAITVCNEWYGAAATKGRYLGIASVLQDQPTDFSTLHFQCLDDGQNDTVPDTGKRESYYQGEIRLEGTLDSAYNEFYGATTNMLIENGSDENGKTCLLIGDSYSRCLYRYVASNYARTAYILPGNNETSSSLLSLMDTYKPDDVIIIANCLKYSSISWKSPGFTEL